jgi:hypothetical protein
MGPAGVDLGHDAVMTRPVLFSSGYRDRSRADLVICPLLRDTPALRKQLGSEVRAEHIKRVKVTITVEELES